jgi:hypothetical protein
LFRGSRKGQLTRNAILLLWVKDALVVDSLGQVILSLLAELEIFHSHLANEFEVFFKLLSRLQMVVVKLHASDVRIRSGTDPERGHTPTYVRQLERLHTSEVDVRIALTVYVKCTVRESV